MTPYKHVLLAALLASGMAVPAVAKDKKPAEAEANGTAADAKNLSKTGRAAIMAAQKQDAAGDSAGTIVTVKAALAAGGLNPTDIFYLSQTELGAATKVNDNAALEEAVRLSSDSPFLPAAEKPKYLRNAAALALQRKDYNAATKSYEQLILLTPDDADAILNLSLLYSDQKQNAQAIATLEKATAAMKAKGQPAPEVWYRQRLKLAFDSKLVPQTISASNDLVGAYPNPVNWYDVVNVYRDSANGDDQFSLDVYRFMHSVQAMGPDREWQEYARVALDRGLPGEAKSILDEGIASKKLTGTKPIEKEIASGASSKIAADKASLPGLEKDSAKAANGKTALGTGDAYFGYGNYAKAAEMYRAAVAKGGVDANTANLRLGASLAMSGDKAGATTALQAVQGQRQQLAQFWLIKLNGKA